MPMESCQQMNPVEIEQAITDLAAQPYDPVEFPYVCQLRLDLTIFTGSTQSNLTVCYERGADIPVNFTAYGLSYDHFSFVEVIA